MRSSCSSFAPFSGHFHKTARFFALPFLALAALLLAFSSSVLANPPTVGFVLIPAGTFLMGTQGQVKDAAPSVDETLQHTVTITKAFYLKETEVTRGEWFAVMGTRPWLEANGDPKPNVHGVGSLEDDNYPVTHISHTQAVAYCAILNARFGGPWFRLPTEAEWEYACREGERGNNLLFAPGVTEENLDDYAWYTENSQHITPPLEKSPHPVGDKLATSFGLFDMHGNVGEWVSDWYHPEYYDDSPQNDPQGPVTSDFNMRVVRGGNFNSASALPAGADDCRCANRAFMAPATETSPSTGFRVVRAVSVPGSGGRFVPATGGGDSGGGGCYIMNVLNR
jgi:formylglycine-generating enzyme required for sulfatase activity